MIDRCLRRYLESLPTEDLDAMLGYYLRDKNYVNRERIILEVLRILRQRDACETAGNNSPSDKTARNSHRIIENSELRIKN